MELKDKVVVVTGAGRGAGRSIALALAREGARLALAARTELELNAMRDEVQARVQRPLPFLPTSATPGKSQTWPRKPSAPSAPLM